MLSPVRIHIPNLVAGGSYWEFVLEEEISQSAWLLNPTLFFWNTSTEDLDLRVQMKLQFDPSYSSYEAGTFYSDVFPESTILPGGRQTVNLQDSLSVLCSTVYGPQDNTHVRMALTHIIRVTNNTAVPDTICRFILTGVYDEALRELGTQMYVLESP